MLRHLRRADVRYPVEVPRLFGARVDARRLPASRVPELASLFTKLDRGATASVTVDESVPDRSPSISPGDPRRDAGSRASRGSRAGTRTSVRSARAGWARPRRDCVLGWSEPAVPGRGLPIGNRPLIRW